jgi:hypothetical protein
MFIRAGGTGALDDGLLGIYKGDMITTTREEENPGWLGPRGASQNQPNPDGNCDIVGGPRRKIQ